MLIPLVTSIFLFTAVVTDCRAKVIPNSVTYTAIAAGLSLGVLTSAGELSISDLGIIDSFMGLASCFSIMFSAWLFAGVGGGDVKLATALGSLMGMSMGLSALAYTYLIAGGGILIWLMCRTTFVPQVFELLFCFLPAPVVFLYRDSIHTSRREMTLEVPMAGFFAAGTACAFMTGPIL